MTKAQKIIKYLAIAFAVYLIFNIVAGIFWGIGQIAGVAGLHRGEDQKLEHLEELTTNITKGDLATLKMELNKTNLKIVRGDVFKAESDSPYITCKQNKNQIVLKEKENHISWRGGSDAPNLTVTIPEDLVLDDVEIDAGFGSVAIQELNAEDLYFKVGAGEVTIDGMNITKRATIEGGLGEVTIKNAYLNDLDLELGIGEISLEGTLTGDSSIEAGIGQVTVTLLDKLDNYRFKVDKGIGAIRIGGVSVADDTQYGTGASRVEISGGIGEIDIREK